MLAELIFLSMIATAPQQCIVRDGRGRIARSASARQQFVKQNPCPSGGNGRTCQGHIVPLKRCGADEPANMQWQTIPEARAKDRWE
jgi:hypothetical protein